MNARWITSATLAALATSGLWVALAYSAEPNASSEPKGQPEPPARAAVLEANAVKNDTKLDSAREQAKLMHDIYASTLEVMHHRYFHGDRTTVPARAMEDIFADMKKSSGVEARWISVNLEPMSLDHKPKNDFEKQAAKEIAGGKAAVETVDEGFYRRAGAIPLSSGCVSCHQGFFKASSTAPKFAGLIISLPLEKKPEKSE